MEKDIILSKERVIFMIELEKYRMELDSIRPGVRYNMPFSSTEG
jgi:hypothetical protein